MAAPVSGAGSAKDRTAQAAARGALAAALGLDVANGGVVTVPTAPVRAATQASILALLSGFLNRLREQDDAYLRRALGPRARVPGDVDRVVRAEAERGAEFARRSEVRVRAGLERALTIQSAGRRGQAVARVLRAEERFVVMRQEAMLARAIAAVDRARLRFESPWGAFWRIGIARDHTAGCLIMTGKAWPWAVLDRVHPPRHYGCTSRLWSIGDAIEHGWLPAGLPRVADAIRAAAGVVMEAAVAEEIAAEEDEIAALDELAVRGLVSPGLVAERFVLVEAGVWEERLHPRDVVGKFARKLAGAGKAQLDPETRVQKDTVGGYRTVRKNRIVKFTSRDDAIRDALERSAKSTHPESVGGAKSFRSYDEYLRSRGVDPNERRTLTGEAISSPADAAEFARLLRAREEAAGRSDDRYVKRGVSTLKRRRMNFEAKAGSKPGPAPPPAGGKLEPGTIVTVAGRKGNYRVVRVEGDRVLVQQATNARAGERQTFSPVARPVPLADVTPTKASQPEPAAEADPPILRGDSPILDRLSQGNIVKLRSLWKSAVEEADRDRGLARDPNHRTLPDGTVVKLRVEGATTSSVLIMSGPRKGEFQEKVRNVDLGPVEEGVGRRSPEERFGAMLAGRTQLLQDVGTAISDHSRTLVAKEEARLFVAEGKAEDAYRAAQMAWRRARNNALGLNAGEALARAIAEEQKTAKTMRAARKAYHAAAEARRKPEGSARARALAEVRDGFGKGEFTGRKPTGKLAPLLERAATRVPREWIDGNERPALKTTTGRAYYTHRKATRRAIVSQVTVREGDESTMLHELGHWIEYRQDQVREASRAFHTHRTRGEDAQPLRKLRPGSGYRSDEMAKPDGFADPYAGKIYPAERTWETFTMGLEGTFYGRHGIDERDQTHAHWTLGVLALL